MSTKPNESLLEYNDGAAAVAERALPVVKTKASKAAQLKVRIQRIDIGAGEILPVRSFRTLMGDLATHRLPPCSPQ